MKIKIVGKTKMFRISGNDELEFEKGVVFTCDPQCADYDWLVAFDDLSESEVLRCPRERTILATWEPVNVKPYLRPFVEQFGHYLSNRPEWTEMHPHYHLGRGYFPWFVLRPLKKLAEEVRGPKTDSVVAICTKKSMRHTAHHARFALLSFLLKRMPGMKWFGFGFNRLSDKYAELCAAKYHLVVENNLAPHGWSEKIADALLCECLPFYAGDPKLEEVLPRDAFVRIPVDDPPAAERIVREAVAKDEWVKRLPAIREAKRLLLTKYNFWSQVLDVIRASEGQVETPVDQTRPTVLRTRRELAFSHPFAAVLDRIGRFRVNVGLVPTHGGRERLDILVIKLSALGDIVLATGLLREIRERHPSARITLLTRGAFADFGRSMGLFDDVLVDNRERYAGFWKVGFGIVARGNYDLVYDLQDKARTRAYRRIARLCGRWSMVWRLRFKSRYEPDLSFCHGTHENFHLLPERYALLIPGCSPGHPHKMWPAESYRELSRRLGERGVKSVVMGTKAEAEQICAIVRDNPYAVDFMGKSSLADIPDLARGAEVVVGNDTGPSHMSRIAGAKTITLFCKITEKSAREAPNAVNVIREKISDISVDDVLAAADDLI